MFDKEARKWVKENTKIDYRASYGEFPIEPSATKSFKAGAEFVYYKGEEEIKLLKETHKQSLKILTDQIEELHKANEWHYIKDGNLPKENENVLIYSNRANHIGFYRNGFWFTNSDGCLDDDDIEVIAWKEIVLPELPKEIK